MASFNYHIYLSKGKAHIYQSLAYLFTEHKKHSFF